LEGLALHPLHPCGQLTRCFSAVAELLVGSGTFLVHCMQATLMSLVDSKTTAENITLLIKVWNIRRTEGDGLVISLVYVLKRLKRDAKSSVKPKLHYFDFVWICGGFFCTTSWHVKKNVVDLCLTLSHSRLVIESRANYVIMLRLFNNGVRTGVLGLSCRIDNGTLYTYRRLLRKAAPAGQNTQIHPLSEFLFRAALPIGTVRHTDSGNLSIKSVML